MRDSLHSPRWWGGRCCRGSWTWCLCLLGVAWSGLAASVQAAPNQLGPSDVLILVNAASPVSRSIADMYRRYYPQITSAQVLALTGLRDSASLSATPGDEIITRDEFEALIAAPVRSYLISTGMVNTVYCIITTAGMPYRIEDADQVKFANVVGPPGTPETPDGTDANLVVANKATVSAACVESELSVLFQIDPALPFGANLPQAPIKSRLINPYQGYLSPIKSWATERDILNRRTNFRWNNRNLSRISQPPRIEGALDSCSCSATDRLMSPADIYLVARLDGPHVPNVYPIFAVKDMLDRSAAVSNLRPPYCKFVGYNSAKSSIVVDSSPYPNVSELSWSYSYNYPPGITFMSHDDYPVPPGAEMEVGCSSTCQLSDAFRYDVLFSWFTGASPTAGATVSQPIINPTFGGQFIWDDTMTAMSSASDAWPVDHGLFGLATYGRNGMDGRPATYLRTGGPNGGPLFPCVPGAVFTSIESYNAVTMFTNVPTSQAKIAEFIQMGGTAAIGHAFEPGNDAIEDVEYLYSNLMRDDDGDGVGDLSLVEAAYTALPYLSWAEVIIGDPLMRLRSGPGGLVGLTDTCPYDINGDGAIGYVDRLLVVYSYNTLLGDPRYDPAADVNQDGAVSYYDNLMVVYWYNHMCP